MSALKKRRVESEGARIRRLSGMIGEMWAMVCAFTLETDMITYLEDNDYTDGRVYRWAETADKLHIEWENGWIRRVVVLKGWRKTDRPRSPQLREILYLRSPGLEYLKEMSCRRMVFHRDNDLPALIKTDGSKEWYRAGVRHRDGDKPAVIYAGGFQVWYRHGKVHRDGDKPAVINATGQFWYRHGLSWRDNDQPTSVFHDGSKRWHRGYCLHRDNDKPAVVNADGSKRWHVNGTYVNSQDSDGSPRYYDEHWHRRI